MTEWKTVEEALDHLTSELLRLQQRQTPWLMTPLEQSDLLYAMDHAAMHLREDMAPPECEECPPELTEGVTGWLRTEVRPWDYTCEACGSHWDKYPRGAAL